MRLYHPDKLDAYVPLAQEVNDAYEICSDVIKAIGKGEIWRDGNQRAAAPPPLALLDGAASPALADGAGGGGDASVLSVKRKRNPIEKKQTTVKHYCSNKSYMCTHNRNKGTYKAGNGGFRPRYEVTEAGVDPYMTDTPPRVVCKDCNKAGFPDMQMTRNALPERRVALIDEAPFRLVRLHRPLPVCVLAVVSTFQPPPGVCVGCVCAACRRVGVSACRRVGVCVGVLVRGEIAPVPISQFF